MRTIRRMVDRRRLAARRYHGFITALCALL
jgi:hypothetical protein